MKRIAITCIATGLLVPFAATLYAMSQTFGQVADTAKKADAIPSVSAYIPALLWINGIGVILVISGITLLVISIVRSRRTEIASHSV